MGRRTSGRRAGGWIAGRRSRGPGDARGELDRRRRDARRPRSHVEGARGVVVGDGRGGRCRRQAQDRSVLRRTHAATDHATIVDRAERRALAKHRRLVWRDRYIAAASSRMCVAAMRHCTVAPVRLDEANRHRRFAVSPASPPRADVAMPAGDREVNRELSRHIFLLWNDKHFSELVSRGRTDDDRALGHRKTRSSELRPPAAR